MAQRKKKKPRPFSLWREELKRAWRELRGDHATPWRLSLAVALGLFIGSQPIFGLHTPLVLLICLWLRLDAALAWVFSNISNPFFAPFLLTFEAQVGAALLHGELIRFDTHDAGFADYVGYSFLGAPLVGLGLALVGGVGSYVFTVTKRRYFPNRRPVEPYALPDNAPPWVVAVEQVANRYARFQGPVASHAEKARFHYVRIKLVGDPIARLIADAMGDEAGCLGSITDIGTGRGQLPILLLELGRATSATGFDWDEEKIEAAQQAAEALADAPALPARFDTGDARDAPIETADTVLLIDVLHYFKPEQQDAILKRALDAVAPGGQLLVRDADTERGIRSTLTLLEEKFFTLIRFNRGERVHFRAMRELLEIAEEKGFSCEVRPAWGKTPFANVLLVAKRPHSATS